MVRGYGVGDKGKVYDVRVGYAVCCEAKPVGKE